VTGTASAAVSEAAVPLRRNRDFLLLWGGAGSTLLGASAGQVAYPFLVIAHTGSAAQAGLVAFAAMLPILVVQLPAGVFVDRWDRRRLMIACDVGAMLATGTVVVAVFLGRIWLPQLMAAAFLEGSFATFYQLAERAAVRHLVPADQLATALTQNEARWRAAGLLGRPLGGLLYTVAAWAPFLFISLSHLVSLAALLLIRKKMQAERTTAPRRLFTEMAEGLAWAWRQWFLRTVAGLLAGTNVLFQGLSLAVLVIVQHEGRSAFIAGLITAAGGIGGALGALTGIRWMQRVRLPAIVIGGMCAWCVLMPSIAVVRDPVLLGVIYAAMAYVGGLLNVAIGVYQVRVTPDAIQGRVSSVLIMIGIGAGAVGAPAAGLSLDALGVTRTALVIGVIIVLLTAVGARALYRKNLDGERNIPFISGRRPMQ